MQQIADHREGPDVGDREGRVLGMHGGGDAPLTVRVASMAGTRGGDWEILTAGAFISMVIPVLVFLFLQRYFVRGLLAGSVKG